MFFFCNSEKKITNTHKKRNGITLETQMFECNQKERKKNIHTKNYMVLIFRIHINAVCIYAFTARIGTNRGEKADVISFIAIMNTHCFPFALFLSHSFSNTFAFYFRALGSLCANQLYTTKSTNI